MNKREFVIGSAAAAVAALTDPARAQGDRRAAAAATDAAPPAPMSPLRRLPDLAASPDLDAWRPYAGSIFKTHEREVSRLVVLDSIREVARDRHTEQFTLVFRSADGHDLGGGLYTLTHLNGQRVMVYLDPAAATPGTCVAQFNRLV